MAAKRRNAAPRHISPEQDRHMRLRTRIFCISMAVVCFGVLLWRLFVLQIIDTEGYAARAADQQLRDTVIPAARGEILSSDGTVLAASETCWTIRASPRELADELVEPAARALSEILEIDYEETLEKFSQRSSNDCLLRRRVDKEMADAVRDWCSENGAEGIQIRQDTKRVYPEGDFMGCLLGFTDVDNAGLWGLELQYNELLTGENGRVLTAKNAWGYDMPENYTTLVEATPGASLTLTIDANIQHYLESAVSAAVQEHNVASRAVGIVMDVQTGAILAMTVKPDYDPNDPRTIVDEEVRDQVNALSGEERSAALQAAQQAQWRNKAISDLYEPGSVFKLITAAAALDTGVCTPDSQFVCAGSINVAGTRFRCANGHIHGLETFAQGLAVSCNPCSTPGASLTLTIDANIQHYLESAVSAAVQEHNVASRAVGIVMDVQTGAILAMTVKPDYDPNDPRTIVDEEVRDQVNALSGEERSAALQAAQQAQWRNKAISDLYEPGSVFKLITAAAALDTGVCTPDSQFVCAGSINVAGTRFRCANGHIHGLETFAQGLAVSCNPCFIQIGARLGKEAFCDYFEAFGLREDTGIDLPGEIKKSEYYTADRMGLVQSFGPYSFPLHSMNNLKKDFQAATLFVLCRKLLARRVVPTRDW